MIPQILPAVTERVEPILIKAVINLQQFYSSINFSNCNYLLELTAFHNFNLFVINLIIA